VERHITVSGFVVHQGRVALHWHRKIGAWLPAGGHIEVNEDPVQAVLREIREEFAIEAEIMPLTRRLVYEDGPRQIDAPFAVLDCWPEPEHGHVDMVYLCTVVSGYPGVSHDPENRIEWLTAAALESGGLEHDGRREGFLPDVQALGIEAIRIASTLPVRM
jgi:8-oxo-dGTP pyrophosphatase MutT (NUDIX family)